MFTTSWSHSSINFFQHNTFSPSSSSNPSYPQSFSMSRCICLSPSPSASAHENSIRKNKLIILVSLLFIIICVFIIVGVSRIVEIGSVAFFIIIIAGSLVFMCFFFALVALAKSAGGTFHATAATAASSPIAVSTAINNDNPLPQVPVFYFLETIHRQEEEKIVPDDGYWNLTPPPMIRTESQKDVCAICLCDLDTTINTGVSNCCRRRIHVKCAQKYFNVVQRVQCPLCRHSTPPTTGDNSLISSSTSPPPV